MQKSTVSIPDEILAQASTASQALLPVKTSLTYQKEYEDFVSWRKSKKVEGANEEVLLAYYSNVSTKFSPNSLWSKFSMLKTCLKVNENLDISGYGRLFTLLKRNSEGYKPKKSAVLDAEQVTKFLLEAPDKVFLLEKIEIRNCARNSLVI